MKINKDPHIVCVDVEATCWINESIPQGMISEIIEIGYAVLNYKTNEIIENGSIIVKPEKSMISESCERFTGLTQEQVNNGISFAEACVTLESNLKTGSRFWSSYGNYDLKIFKETCERMNVKYPFVPQHLNLKTMCTLLNGETNGLGAAINALGLQFEGKQHTGKADALNVARILQYYKAKFGEKALI